MSAGGRTYVYFVQEGIAGPVKIGVAGSPKIRLMELQVGNPRRLYLRGSCLGGHRLECRLHKKLADHVMRGEWFFPHPEVLAEIVDDEALNDEAIRFQQQQWHPDSLCDNCGTLLVLGEGDTCGACVEVRERRRNGLPVC